MAKMRFAKAVYCAGVDQWYVRIGDRNGEDPMFLCAGEQHAKLTARHVNDVISRLLKKRASCRRHPG